MCDSLRHESRLGTALADIARLEEALQQAATMKSIRGVRRLVADVLRSEDIPGTPINRYAVGARVMVIVPGDRFSGQHATVRSWKRRNLPRQIAYTLDIDDTPMKWGAGPYLEDEIAPERKEEH